VKMRLKIQALHKLHRADRKLPSQIGAYQGLQIVASALAPQILKLKRMKVKNLLLYLISAVNASGYLKLL
jgi:hypothetical protein